MCLWTTKFHFSSELFNNCSKSMKYVKYVKVKKRTIL